MIRRCLVSLALLMPVLGFAHGDEDHGAGVAPTSLTELAPRAETQTELYELVTTLQDGQLTIYLDDSATNQLIADARIEVESGSWKIVANAVENGTYRVAAPQFATPGTYPLVFTVIAGDAADLLETTLVVKSAAQSTIPVDPSPRAIWWWLGGALGVLGVGSGLIGKRRQSARQS